MSRLKYEYAACILGSNPASTAQFLFKLVKYPCAFVEEYRDAGGLLLYPRSLHREFRLKINIFNGRKTI